ncbi:MAG TPA: hypothetical protein VGE12_03455 [Noviherbaspirillum sp.]
MQRSKRFLFLLAGFASAAAFAQSGADTSMQTSGDTASPAMAGLEPRTENGVKYVCGGVGSDEAASMKRAASDYDVMMTFAASTGAYLADVDVAISDSRGRSVLNVTCDGPILLVDLPRGGNYRVQAEAEGRTLTRTAQVGERGAVQRIRMAWPVQTVDMGLSPGAQPQMDAGRTSSGASQGESGSKGQSGQSDDPGTGNR